MPASNYECILLPVAPGYQYWQKAKNRKQAMASLGIDVLTSINTDEGESDSENEDIELDEFMEKHGVPTKNTDAGSPTNSPTSVTCPISKTNATNATTTTVDIKRASSMPTLQRTASESSLNSRVSKRKASSTEGSIGKSDNTYRRGVSLQSKYKRCTNA